MRAALHALAVLAIASGLTGCLGYRLGEVKPSTLKGIHKIAVTTFRNETYTPRVESLVTNTVIKQIQQDGTYEVTSIDKADAVLDGTVKYVSRNPARSVRGNVLATTEFNLALGVGWTMRAKDGHPIAGPGLIAGGTSFFVGSDVTTDERQAIPLAAEDLAVRLVSQLTEGW
ncbi:MAG: LPS assembly lipoprotein LptE [Verrucomicrobiota bacterium]|nr:LPS assembly lipoprotein LptE [Verrucomicrobiota bacterium]